MKKSIVEIFNAVQKSVASHPKYHNQLNLHLFDLENYDNNLKEFLDCLKVVLAIFKKAKCVDRVIQFVLTYLKQLNAVNNDLEGLLIPSVLEFLVSHHNAKDRAVRYRCCQIIGGVLDILSDEPDFIDDDLWGSIEVAMIDRTKDKVATVRIAALSALKRLQNPTDVDDASLIAMLRCLQYDPVKDVRKTALQHVGPSLVTLNQILDRTRDIKNEVRVVAFQTIEKNIDMRSLSIMQRTSILNSGLQDRDDSVKNACIHMLYHSWLASFPDCNVVELLEKLDVENFEECGELILNSLFDLNGTSCENGGVISIDFESYFSNHITNMTEIELTAELAILWRLRCQWLVKHNKRNEMEDLAPNATEFCAIVMNHEKSEFITKQLYKIARNIDIHDEAGRRNLTTFICHKLGTVSESGELVEYLLAVLFKLHDNEQDFLRCVIELLTTLSDIPDALEGADNNNTNNSESAAEVEELKALCEIQIISLVNCVLEQTQQTVENPMIESMLMEYILPGIANINPYIRSKSIRGLGLYCLLDKSIERTIVSQNAALLVHAAQSDVDVEVVEAAHMSLFDIILVYNQFECVSSTGEKEKITESEILNILSAGLDTDIDNDSIRLLSIKGFCKLMFTGRLMNVGVLVRLLLIYFSNEVFNSSIERDNETQFLSIFFPSFVINCKEAHLLLEKAMITALRTVVIAPEESLLKTINIEKFLLYSLYLLSPSNLMENSELDMLHTTVNEDSTKTSELMSHNRVAVEIMLESISYATLKNASGAVMTNMDAVIKNLVKSLKPIHLFNDIQSLYLLKHLGQCLLNQLSSKFKPSINILNKFIDSLCDVSDGAIALIDNTAEDEIIEYTTQMIHMRGKEIKSLLNAATTIEETEDEMSEISNSINETDKVEDSNIQKQRRSSNSVKYVDSSDSSDSDITVEEILEDGVEDSDGDEIEVGIENQPLNLNVVVGSVNNNNKKNINLSNINSDHTDVLNEIDNLLESDGDDY